MIRPPTTCPECKATVETMPVDAIEGGGYSVACGDGCGWAVHVTANEIECDEADAVEARRQEARV